MNADSGDKPLRAVPPLILLALICTGLIVTTVKFTEEKIADNRQRTILNIMGDIIPSPHNNALLKEVMTAVDPALFGSERPMNVYIARQDGRIQGFVFMPVIAAGYSGPVRLAIGINREGDLSGVRVIDEQETEGLGDAVHQRESDWIHGFKGRSFDNTPSGQWRVHDDGGDFDQLSGATITSRGVIERVRDVLEYYLRNKQRLLNKGN